MVHIVALEFVKDFFVCLNYFGMRRRSEHLSFKESSVPDFFLRKHMQRSRLLSLSLLSCLSVCPLKGDSPPWLVYGMKAVFDKPRWSLIFSHSVPLSLILSALSVRF